ncbi:hypothetical protein HG15A2_38510 [Adhaeretor mobilis]|uniref:Uncharacterized protein n=1 Tax=Adhaeretor mobilis TaxID=1930276 RepID=A0A517N056_9BACT|nr:hypothetical protein HG15A2_38510 [Adhaeretor mobilis]
MFPISLMMIRWLASGCTRWATISSFGNGSASQVEVVRIAVNATALCRLSARRCRTACVSFCRVGIRWFVTKLLPDAHLAYRLAPVASDSSVWNPALCSTGSFIDPDNVEPLCVVRPSARQER